jgi:hypothetical protein
MLPPLGANSAGGIITIGAYANPAGRGNTWGFLLLPYLEQGALYTASRGNIATVVSGKRVSGTPLTVFQCPSEPSPSGGSGLSATTIGGANTWASANYVANYNVFGNVAGGNDNLRMQGTSRIPAAIPDGLSNTIFFTERYQTCGSSGNPATGNTRSPLWADMNSTWRPIFCANNLNQAPTAAGYQPCLMFQSVPNWITGCDPTRAQTPHNGGIIATLGDGSVRSVNESVSLATWQRACNPADGLSLGTDWN